MSEYEPLRWEVTVPPDAPTEVQVMCALAALFVELHPSEIARVLDWAAARYREDAA